MKTSNFGESNQKWSQFQGDNQPETWKKVNIFTRSRDQTVLFHFLSSCDSFEMTSSRGHVAIFKRLIQFLSTCTSSCRVRLSMAGGHDLPGVRSRGTYLVRPFTGSRPVKKSSDRHHTYVRLSNYRHTYMNWLPDCITTSSYLHRKRSGHTDG